MTSIRFKFGILLSLGVLTVTDPTTAFGAENAPFPAQPLRLVVPASPDGGASLQAQALAPLLRTNLAQQVLVEHRAGAGGIVGSASVAQAPADGHTLLLTSAALAVNAGWLPEQLSYEVLSGFAPVSVIATAPLVLLVHPGVPAKTVPELVALAKRERPMVKVGGNAAGSLSHVALSQFALASGFRSQSELFSGGGPALQSLIGGQLDLLFAAAPLAVPPVTRGRLRALAVTSAEPMAQFAGVRVMKDFYPGMVIENWYALLAPAATPRPAITRLHTELRRALADESVQALYSRLGLVAVGSTPEALALMLRSDVERYTGLIRQGHLRMQ